MPRGYDCATPGFENPLTLEEAIELSKTETVVYLYGKGIQDLRWVADILTKGDNGLPLRAIATPGINVPKDSTYVIILGKVVKHRVSEKPVEFYQKFINRGKIFNLTRGLHERWSVGNQGAN